MAALAEEAAALLGIAITPAHEAAFERYALELAAWNAHTNLTAITDPVGVRVRHFLDSLTLARMLPAAQAQTGLKLIDVGSGAGFPGLPLKIVFPDIEVTLLEATGKKIAFLRHVVEILDLSGVTFVNARAEEAGQNPDYREQYNIVAARAVARMPVLAEYLLPLVAVGGAAVAMKGSSAADETKSARKAFDTLGGKLRGIETFQLPETDESHHLVIVDKIAPTPAMYPRRPGMPTQKPIR